MTVTAKRLPKLHTKVLLKALQSTRAFSSNIDRIIESVCVERGLNVVEQPSQDELDKKTIVDGFLIGGFYPEESTVTVAQLKAELAKREHVPNKQESIALRKAKQQRNRQKGRKNK